MQLLSESLHFGLQKLTGLGLTVLRKLRLQFLRGPRDSFSEHALVVSDVLAKSLLLKHVDALLTGGLVGFLQDGLIHVCFRLRHGSLHLDVVALDTLFNSTIAFVLAYVGPCVLNVWHRALVNG